MSNFNGNLFQFFFFIAKRNMVLEYNGLKSLFGSHEDFFLFNLKKIKSLIENLDFNLKFV